VLSKNGTSASNGALTNGTEPLNGWARIFGVIGLPGRSPCLVWWLTQSLAARLDRIIQLLDQIARAAKVPAS
jgi:hypothetical protein